MRLDLDIEGLDELIKGLEESASEAEIRELNKNIVTKVQPLIKQEMARKMPKSGDISLSGRGFGSLSSVSAHAAEEIPVEKVKTSGTRAEAAVGWTQADNSSHFYVKFINWGTIYRPPQEFIFAAGRAVDGQIESIAEEEYQRFLNRTVG